MPIDPAPIDLDAEEARSRMVARRYQRFFGGDGLVEQFERCGDPLVELRSVAVLVSGPELPEASIVRRFVEAVRLGSFPRPGAGFRDYPDRRAVRDLLDFYHFNQFSPGQYPLRPSLLTVEARPWPMRARRSVWRRWLAELGWLIPWELQDSPGGEAIPVVRELPATSEAALSAYRRDHAGDKISIRRFITYVKNLGLSGKPGFGKKYIHRAWIKAGLPTKNPGGRPPRL